MKAFTAIVVFVFVFTLPINTIIAGPDCNKNPKHKSCVQPKENGTTGCPEGTVYVDTWGCVPYQ